VNGREVELGGLPFMAAVFHADHGGVAGGEPYCGGTLVGATKVLTAGHCLRGFGGEAGQLRVLVGRTSLNAAGGVVRGVARFAVHPGYDAHSGRNDLAVLTLDRPVDTARYPPIGLDLAGRYGEPGRPLTVAGWGSTRPQPGRGGPANEANLPSRLRRANVPVVSAAGCARSYGPGTGTAIDPASMICAGRGNRDACQGDSGGPLFTATGDGFVQVGVISSGLGCADPDYPGVYARVSGAAAFLRRALAA
jgi:secreted trypsin-like serine protease